MSSKSTIHATSFKKLKQSSLSLLKRRDSNNDNRQNQELFEKALVAFVVDAMIPLSVVENKNFIENVCYSFFISSCAIAYNRGQKYFRFSKQCESQVKKKLQ